MKIVPYVVATRPLQERLNLQRAGSLVVDPRDMETGPFLSAVGELDAAIYGARGLDLPRWALYDCAAIPGLVCGFAAASATEAPAVAKALGVSTFTPMAIPLSRGIALPTLERDHWLAWSVTDVATILPAAGADRRAETLVFIMELLGTQRISGLTQWTSSQLDIFVDSGTLRLLAAWLPAHSLPATAVFEREDARELGEPRLIEPGHESQLRALQAEIEAGSVFYIVGPRDSAGRVPIAPAAEVGA